MGRKGLPDWGHIQCGIAPTKKQANKFFFNCVIDYQMESNALWFKVRDFIENELGDPSDLWGTVRSLSKKNWMSRCANYRLHRFPQAHERLWNIAGVLVSEYKADARNVWKRSDAAGVLERLESMNMGPQLSRMTVGALLDLKQLDGCGDVKADLHVRRTLGRLVDGEDSVSALRALEIARELHPRNPWKLDGPLFQIGKNTCRPEPKCDSCDLSALCRYANS